MSRFLPLFLLPFVVLVSTAQPPVGAPSPAARQLLNQAEAADFYKHEAAKYDAMKEHYRSVAEIDTRFDVTYYDLHLNITTDTPNLAGKVTMKAKVLSTTLDNIFLDLAEEMIVDSVTAGGSRVVFTHPAETLKVALDRTYNQGEYFSITTYYSGYPANTGFGAFSFADHDSIPWVYTLSEPYYARNWWPCKDYPTDKADSSDMTVTTDSAMKVGSNGILVSRLNNGDGTATTHWCERYPIGSYLISVTFSDFAEFTNWYKYSPTDSMPVIHYVLPQRLAAAETSLALTTEMLSLYAKLYGEYPFIKEKYGHAMFGWGGGMEHQTMTSTSTFSEIVICHELTHQWFGDKITCGSWHDIWLNEGFASYGEALWVEHRYGQGMYATLMGDKMNRSRMATQSVGGVDTADIRTLFNPYSTYAKGAVVLHMLRRMLGDSLFFAGLRSYAADPRFAYKTARTSDFRGVMESVSGRDLAWFFDQWLYRTGYPTYHMTTTFDSTGGLYSVSVKVDQLLSVASPDIYIMPVDLKITTSEGDTIVTVWNDSASQTWSIPLSARPVGVVFDPENTILKGADSTTGVDGGAVSPTAFFLDRNYPQPFNPSTTIRFGLHSNGYASLKVYDILGREVGVLADGVMTAGEHTTIWNAGGLASGVYFCRLQAGGMTQTRKLLLAR